LGDVEGAEVELEPGRGELADRVRGRLGEARVLPDLGGQGHDRGLVGLQRDLGQRDLVVPHPVARLVAEVGVHSAPANRHAAAARSKMLSNGWSEASAYRIARIRSLET